MCNLTTRIDTTSLKVTVHMRILKQFSTFFPFLFFALHTTPGSHPDFALFLDFSKLSWPWLKLITGVQL